MTSRGATLIHSCVVILEQAITNPPLNMDILKAKLWPLSRIFIYWPTAITLVIPGKVPFLIEKWGKNVTKVCKVVAKSRILCLWNSYIKCWYETAEKYTLFSKISWIWYPKRGPRWCIKKYPFPRFFARGWQHDQLEWPPRGWPVVKYSYCSAIMAK